MNKIRYITKVRMVNNCVRCYKMGDNLVVNLYPYIRILEWTVIDNMNYHALETRNEYLGLGVSLVVRSISTASFAARWF